MRVTFFAGLMIMLSVAMDAVGQTSGPALVTPMQEAADVAGLRVLAKVDWQKPMWDGIAPVYDHAERGRRYRVWIGVGAGASGEGLLFHVIVNDPDHSREFREREIWRGDCIFIGLDGRDDTRGNELKAYDFALDDCSYIFAYGKDGPDAYIDKAGNPRITRQDLLKMIRQMTRDDAAEVTTYDIAIPWSALGSAAGQSPSVGVAMTFKDAVPSEDEDVDWGAIRTWGKGRVFNRFALPALPADGQDVFSFAPRSQRMKRAGDSARLVLAARQAQGGEAVVRFGGTEQRITLPRQGGIGRWEITIPMESTGLENQCVSASLEKNGQVAAQYSVQLESPAIAYGKISQRIAKLLENPPHELVRTHLRSTMKVIDSVYQNLDTPGERYVDEPELFINTVNFILGKLPADRFDWDRYQKQCLPLVFAFISNRDSSLQFYSVQLPYGWQKDQRYPVTFYLHGSGSPNPMGGLLNCYDNSGQDTIFREVDIDPTTIPASHQGFLVAPWCRGNSMYHDAGESDVWQIVDLVKQQFQVDENRMYLSGFSMGGGGTWNLAGRRPDLWAAVSPASGFWDGSDTNLGFLTDNLRGMPVKIWCGELDARMVPGAKKLAQTLKGQGNECDLTIAQKIPHSYPYLDYQGSVAWMMRHTRKLGNEWSYTTDSSRYPGTRGVEMIVPARVDPAKLPKFTCKVEDSVVKIDTWNTPGVRVNLGEGGLGLKGTVTVLWNGKQVYSGEPKRVAAGDVPSWWR